MSRRSLVSLLALAAAVAAAVVGFLVLGPGGRLRGERDSCPGADPCPYSQVALIGQRGEGVLRKPEALALSPSGEVYVADQFSYMVQRFSPRGRFLGEWGSYGSGNGQFGAIDGLAVDTRGDVYVVDSAHDRIEKFDPEGRFARAWGSPGRGVGQFNFGYGGGPGSPPSGAIAVYGPYVYVADTDNNRIERFTLDGARPTVWRNLGHGGKQAFGPRAIAITRKYVYVADEGNRRMLMLDHRGRLLRQAGSYGRGRGQFSDPFGVAVGPSGEVFVADNNNNRIVRLTRNLRYVKAWRGQRSARLSFVRAVAADAGGHVYVADTGNDRVEVFNRNGRLLRRWGISGDAPGQLVAPLGVAAGPRGPVVVETFGSRSPIFRFSRDLAFLARWTRGGGAVLGRHFFSPTSAAVGPDGSVWVTDRGNGLVRHLSARGRFVNALGYVRGRRGSRLPGAFNRPGGVAVDGAGRVYVADTFHAAIKKFTARGALLAVYGRGRLRRPQALAVDRQGRMYVADSGADRVVKLSPRGRLLGEWGSRGSAPGSFRDPVGIAVDPHGQVFVADRGNDRVQKFSAAGRLLSAWGVSGTSAGEFSQPAGLSIDCRGNVLVADTRNNRVQVFRRVAAPSSCSPRA